jgi:glycosyltransferase involved in cell wall biosynthesis
LHAPYHAHAKNGRQTLIKIMRFTVFTHVEHNLKDNSYFAYAPYIREMNLWINKFEQVEIVAPMDKNTLALTILPYNHSNLIFTKIKAFNLLSFNSIFKTLGVIPFNLYRIFKAMYKSDHIHIRTPGNIGLLAAIVQIFFPYKKKTVKYAGNWDPKSIQPWSYKLQKWILKNSVLTRRCKVLIYGNWGDEKSNILPFFTASFQINDFGSTVEKSFDAPYQFIFVGSYVDGKRPRFAIALVEELNKRGYSSKLSLYGDGPLRNDLLSETSNKEFLEIKQSVELNELKEIYKTSQFLILPSKSEGWPKAVAEAMAFGCIPIVTSVSCIPYMLDYGKRGIIIDSDLNNAVFKVINHLKHTSTLMNISKEAEGWSRKYTLEKFDREIAKLI